jgi:hypothetical protein
MKRKILKSRHLFVCLGVFVDDHDLNDAHGRRSVDIPQEFGNLKAARFAIQEYEKHNGNLGRVARPL